eukprot:7031477-Prymnesium_polylepis.2
MGQCPLTRHSPHVRRVTRHTHRVGGASLYFLPTRRIHQRKPFQADLVHAACSAVISGSSVGGPLHTPVSTPPPPPPLGVMGG